MAFGRKKGEDYINEKEKEVIEGKSTNDYFERRDDATYTIKILIPTDKFSMEYKAFFVTENENYTPDIDRGKVYYTFESAVEDAKYITERFKKDKIWAPTFVCKKRNNA
ncbi:MAG: hypothetical protein IJ772_04685 [Bacilli bacterium]|nr:hypothetical protein [Bacilli bacterium]